MRVARGVQRGAAFTISVDGAPVAAFPGETVAAAMLAAGIRAFGRTPSGAARGLYCNMGVCHECLVEMAAGPAEAPLRLRACVTLAAPGLDVRTGRPDDGVR